MPEFNLIPNARSSPTHCALCHDPRGPFVDTGVELLDGRVLVCASITGPDGALDRAGCVEQMARAVGSVDKETHTEVLRERVALGARVTLLEAAVKSGQQVDVDAVIGRLEAAATNFEKMVAKLNAKKPAAAKA